MKKSKKRSFEEVMDAEITLTDPAPSKKKTINDLFASNPKSWGKAAHKDFSHLKEPVRIYSWNINGVNDVLNKNSL